MKTEMEIKEVYQKPEIEVVNLETEGVFAGSGGEDIDRSPTSDKNGPNWWFKKN